MVSYLYVSIAWKASADKLFCYNLNINIDFYLGFHVLIEQIKRVKHDKFGLSSMSLLSDVYFSLNECLISSF